MAKKKVGYQGIAGCYSEKAIFKFFGDNKVSTTSFKEFESVFRAVEQSKIDYGIIPLENSLAGSIVENYDHLMNHKVWICGELKLRVKHQLLGVKGSKIEKIKKVKSHPQALAQCKKTLKSLGRFELVPYFDTAGAVKTVVELNNPEIAAIGSDSAAATYPVKTLKSGIEDNHENYTRFVVICKNYKKPKSDSKCKTSIVYILKSIPGALFKSLSVFATRDIDLLKIESRPIQGSPFAYQFFIDFIGSSHSEVGQNALRHLNELSDQLKVLGSYYY